MISISDSAKLVLSRKHRKTLNKLLSKPAPKTMEWEPVAAMIVKAEGVVKETKSGSGIMAALNGCKLRLHKPHGRDKVLHDYQVKDVIDFLLNAGILEET
jgi:hypothetical protein